jgi:hypothetical protein
MSGFGLIQPSGKVAQVPEGDLHRLPYAAPGFGPQRPQSAVIVSRFGLLV